ncbi:MAG: ABC transporter permease [Bacteroidales bacterium]|nr:ABC transporter permease [Bacteroidales bacterium]
MNFKTISVIISREYVSRVKKKSFLLTTFLGPIFFAAICILPTLIMLSTNVKSQTVAIVDESGIVAPAIESSEKIIFKDMTCAGIDSLKANFSSLGLSAILTVSPFDPVAKTVEAAVYTEKPISIELEESISHRLDKTLEAYKVNLYNIPDLKEIMDEVKSGIKLKTYTLSSTGEDKMTASEVYMMLSLILSMIIYMFITMFSSMVMRGVIEEKASKVIEVLVSSVKATELMFGKIIGVALVALTQFFMWIALTGVILAVFFGIAGGSMAASSGVNTEEIVAMAGAGTDISGLAAMLSDQDSPAGLIFTTLSQLPMGKIILCFILYFVLGFLLYASLFAAIGSAVENEADTNQLQLPVTIPLLIGFFVAFYAFKSPDAAIVQWCSHIPFTSPIVMLARIPYGVGWGEIIISIAILLATFVGIAYLSASIYKVGILISGKKTTFKDLYKWLKMK